MADDCIICKVVAGDIPSDRVWEDERFIAFRDIDPKAATHVLVVPREHHRDITAWARDADDPGAAPRAVAAVAAELGVADGFRMIVNTGAAAGQTVFHVHWHILAGSDLPGFA
jgi:histidine triad (HIT) family protein